MLDCNTCYKFIEYKNCYYLTHLKRHVKAVSHDNNIKKDFQRPCLIIKKLL